VAKKEEVKKPDWETSNIGLMLFTSLMIILLAFFILLNSMAVIDEKRRIEAYGSLIGAFGILPGGLSPTATDGSHLVPATGPISEIDNDMRLIREILAKRMFENTVHILRGRNRHIISLDAALLFPPDGVELTAEMQPELLRIADIIRKAQYDVVVESHTDDQPPQTEAYRDNWQISTLRAANVLRFLLEEGRMDSERLTAYGYAGYKPIVANTSPQKRARNNRVDLVLDRRSAGKAVARERQKRRKSKSFDFEGFNFRLFREKTPE
jgi:chemotaxis protein MotB